MRATPRVRTTVAGDARAWLCAGLGLCAALACGVPDAGAERATRLALVIGANLGVAPDGPLRFAESDAARFGAVLRELGRHQARDVRILLGPSPESVVRALRGAASRVRRLRKLGRQVIYTFYYSGHAGPAELRLSGRTLPLAELRRQLRRVSADVRISIIDACHSGAFATLARKGGQPTTPFRVRLVDELAAKGEVFIASSAPNEDAQESANLGGSFFTSHFVSGLRGAADRNGDARVTLNEAYEHAYAQTLRSTALSHVGLQHPGYRYDVQGRRELVLSWPGGAASKLVLHASTSGPFLVFSEGGHSLYAEVPTPAGHAQTVALPTGTYLVQKRTPKGLLASTVRLAQGDRFALHERVMAPTAYDAAIALRGGAQDELRWVGGAPSFAGLGVELRVLPVVSLGFGGGYFETARAFQFSPDGVGGVEVGAAFDRWRWLSIGLAYGFRTTTSLRRLDELRASSSQALLDLRTTLASWRYLRVQLAAGFGLYRAEVSLKSGGGQESSSRVWTGGVRAGFFATVPLWRGLGFQFGYQYAHVPALITDALGRAYGVGGHQLTLFGLTARL